MAHDIFISYSSKNKKTADAVCAALEEYGMRCWIAPRDITPGKEWGEAIVTAISESKIMVLIFSSAANQSQQVLREVERAVNKNVIIVPFRIEDVVPTKSMEYFLYSTHWLDALTPDMEAHIGELVETVCKVASIEKTASKPEDKKSKQKAKSKQKIFIAIAAAITIISLAFGSFGMWMALSSKNDSRKPAAVVSRNNGKLHAKTAVQPGTDTVPVTNIAPDSTLQSDTPSTKDNPKDNISKKDNGSKQSEIAKHPSGNTPSKTKSDPVKKPLSSGKKVTAPVNQADIPKTQLKTGDYIRFGTYNGQPIQWRVINLDKAAAPLLLTDNIISIKGFDAKEANSTDEKRKKFGSNLWINSNIREWLNSASRTVNYSTSPPAKEGLCYKNEFNSEPGFLTNFSAGELKLIKPCSRSVILPVPEKDMKDAGKELYSFGYAGIITEAIENFDKAFSKTVQDKVFLLSVKEAKEYVFDRGWSLKAVPTVQAEERDVSHEFNLLKKETEGYWMWWLSTPCATGSYCEYYVDEHGEIGNTDAFVDMIGVRPAMYLSASKLNLKGTGTKDDPYVFNEKDK
ncbi:MAG TPA: TIR domain-containing protein [Clostridia bacterium]|nr:TIR domain-containing protein [Clostridia bacterium]